jgi:predicted nucleic acid-binding protein
MILVDTSVWIEHLRAGSPGLARLLEQGLVLAHPSVIGELACGNLKNRSRVLADLAALPCAVEATQKEALQLIGHRGLWGAGLGWIDVHLLASALLTNCGFWTLDRKLQRAAGTAGIGPQNQGS